ncbi:hypothetical protein Hanom_Chr04g00336361 [Helianthus anomalus]
MAKFLRESKLNKALTDRTIFYESHVRRFWSSVRYVEDEKLICSALERRMRMIKI